MRRTLAAGALTFLLWNPLVIICVGQEVPAKLDPKVYDQYLGTYQFASNEMVVIGRTQYRLFFYQPQTERLVERSTLRPETRHSFRFIDCQ